MFVIGPSIRLTPEIVQEVAKGRVSIRVDANATAKMTASRQVVERLVRAEPAVYGVTTGFGDLARIPVSPSDVDRLQLNLVRSHAAGTGRELSADVVRAMILLRAHALALGLSGVRPTVVEALCDLLNQDVIPVVPSRGSVGASGDLAPLAHIALVLIGEGIADVGGERMPGELALARAGLRPLRLGPKEGLALLNGTQQMVACGSLALSAGESLAANADLIGAMSLEAMRGTATGFDEVVQLARAHRGQSASAEALRRWLAGSEIADTHRQSDHKIQDAYSLRCMPQVHGAVRDALGYLRGVLETEMNAVTDNPLVFPPSPDHPDGRVLSAGNFHGAPVAIALDLAKIALTQLASISERRTARLIDHTLSDGLPAFLSHDPGLSNGYMALHYTAASLINELQSLAHPNSIHSLPTSANQEDHVSMGATSGNQLLEVVDRVERLLAIEAICAAQGLDFRAPAKPGVGVAAALSNLREAVPHLHDDRPPAADLDSALRVVRLGSLLKAAGVATSRIGASASLA